MNLFRRFDNLIKIVQLVASKICNIMEIMARVSTSDNLYLIQTVLSPKQYWRIMGGTVVYIGEIEIDADRAK
jgi:hypothetical protein